MNPERFVKICPACGMTAPLQANICQRCAHNYRTKFAPVAAVPDPTLSFRVRVPHPPAIYALVVVFALGLLAGIFLSGAQVTVAPRGVLP